MEISSELLFLAQTHHISGISSSTRLDSLSWLHLISFLADGSLELESFIFVIWHDDLRCLNMLERWATSNSGHPIRNIVTLSDFGRF